MTSKEKRIAWGAIIVFLLLIINLIIIPHFRDQIFKIENQATAILTYAKGKQIKIFDNCIGINREDAIEIYNKKDGELAWSFDYVSNIIAGEFSVENDAMFLLDEEHVFSKINFSTGKKEWAHKLEENLSKDNKLRATKGMVIITFQYSNDSTEFHFFDTQYGRLVDKVIFGKKTQKINYINTANFLKRDLDWSKFYYFADLRAGYYLLHKKMYFLKDKLKETANHFVAKKITYDDLVIYKRAKDKQSNLGLDSLKIEQLFNPKLRAVRKNYMIVETNRKGTGEHIFVYNMNDLRKKIYETELKKNITTSDNFYLIEQEQLGQKVLFKNLKNNREIALELPKGFKVKKATADEHYCHLILNKEQKRSYSEMGIEKTDSLSAKEKALDKLRKEWIYILPLDFMDK